MKEPLLLSECAQGLFCCKWRNQSCKHDCKYWQFEPNQMETYMQQISIQSTDRQANMINLQRIVIGAVYTQQSLVHVPDKKNDWQIWGEKNVRELKTRGLWNEKCCDILLTGVKLWAMFYFSSLTFLHSSFKTLNS